MSMFVCLFYPESWSYPVYITASGPLGLTSQFSHSGGDNHVCGDHVSCYTCTISMACYQSYILWGEEIGNDLGVVDVMEDQLSHRVQLGEMLKGSCNELECNVLSNWY